MKRLGVIGGLGPLATAQFMEMVVRMTDARHDRDHIPMIINSYPATPDRTRFILGQSEDSPLPTMVRIGQELGHGAEHCHSLRHGLFFSTVSWPPTSRYWSST